MALHHEASSKIADAAPAKVFGFDQLAILEGSRFAFWVYGFEERRVLWSNDAAMALWAADSREELLSRDLGTDMTPSVAARLDQFRTDLQRGLAFDEFWTIYPGGQVRRLMCRFRAILSPAGRIAMLCEAQPLDSANSELIRTSQALLFTDAMVTMYAPNGECLYGNPAARRAFRLFDEPLQNRILDDQLRDHLSSFGGTEDEGRFVARIETVNGPRIHEVEVRICFDPISAQPAHLLTEYDITEQEQAKARMVFLASHDPLTGVGNRLLLARQGAQILDKARAQGGKVQLMMLDLDRFKYVNDTMGHSAGDAFLQTIARRISDWLPQEGVMARIGGDEFCIVLALSDAEAKSRRAAKSILRLLEQPVTVEERQFSLSGSLGIAQWPDHGDDFDSLLQCADKALAAAKEADLKEPAFYHRGLADKGERFLALSRLVKEASRKGRLELHYQPRVCIDTNEILGVEALMRLRDLEGRPVPPEDFIPVAEATGEIMAMGRWALRQAVQDLSGLTSAGKPLGLAVNVAPQQFNDPGLLPLLRQLVAILPGGAAQLELEVTESALVSEDSRSSRTLQRIAELGIPLSVDDFGSAYSNLARLQRFPVHSLKIDKSLTNSVDKEMLLKGVMAIAQAIKAKVVAEGVECAVQREWLRGLGCNEYQGFLFSEPLPLAQLKQLLDSQAMNSAAE